MPLTDAETQVQQYLRMAAACGTRRDGFAYRNTCDWLLVHGQAWTPPATTTPMLARQCFTNAYRVARRRRWRYVEGYAAGIIPVLHAWVVDDADRVLELTWDTPGVAYFGAAFPWQAVRARRQVGRECSMLDDWERGYPLLRAPAEHA